MNENITVNLKPVDSENWRAVTRLSVREDQREFVAEPAYYLCLCTYGKVWHPLAVCLEGEPAGFLMWALDEEDRSCWLGGFLMDREYQGRGFGRQALTLAMEQLSEKLSPSGFALSYLPRNGAGKLYGELGFVETGEKDDDELVARRPLSVRP